MERRGQDLAVSISPDSVSSAQRAQPDRQPNPLRFRPFNQGGNVLRSGAGMSRFLSAEMRKIRGWEGAGGQHKAEGCGGKFIGVQRLSFRGRFHRRPRLNTATKA